MLIHSSSGQNSLSRVHPNPGVSSAGSQGFGPSSTAFPEYRQGAGSEMEQPGFELPPTCGMQVQGNIRFSAPTHHPSR